MSLFRRKQKHSEIVPNQDFLHGSDRFVKGQRYRVDANLARYFERNGWTEGSDVAPPAVVSIEVDDSVLGTKDNVDG